MSLSQLKTVPLVIDDIEFSTTQFPAMRALEVMVTLQKMSAGHGASTSITSAMIGMEPASMKKLVLDLLECTTALIRTPQPRLVTLNKTENIDLIFSGKLKMLFEVITHAVEVNYGDFGDGSTEPAPTTQTLDQ